MKKTRIFQGIKEPREVFFSGKMALQMSANPCLLNAKRSCWFLECYPVLNYELFKKWISGILFHLVFKEVTDLTTMVYNAAIP